MSRRTELLALAERVEREIANRELDSEIWRVVNGWAVADGEVIHGMWFRRDPDDSVAFEAPPFFSSSIDAQAGLPGQIRSSSLCLTDGTVWMAETETVNETGHYVGAYAPTEPSARLAALLRAMAEDGE